MTWLIFVIVIVDVVLFTMIGSKIYNFLRLVWAHKRVIELERRIKENNYE